MVKSNWCRLHEADREERIEMGECPEDQGGYFIVKGSEKVVVGQERMAYNFVYTFKSKIESEPWITEIRSLPKGIGALPAVFKLAVKYDKGKPRIVCKIKNVNKDIPLPVLMRALGIQTDLKIFNCVCEKNITELEAD
jgi:DNA-directed RNA polymerase II subunit RPB2